MFAFVKYTWSLFCPVIQIFFLAQAVHTLTEESLRE